MKHHRVSTINILVINELMSKICKNLHVRNVNIYSVILLLTHLWVQTLQTNKMTTKEKEQVGDEF
jgi:hypothetical protein